MRNVDELKRGKRGQVNARDEALMDMITEREVMQGHKKTVSGNGSGLI